MGGWRKVFQSPSAAPLNFAGSRMSNPIDPEIQELEAILERRLHIFEAYHSGTRTAETERAKRFLPVLAGNELPTTKNEKAYLHHLRKIGRPIIHVGRPLPDHFKSNPWDVGKKWDDAAENMSSWKPWDD